MRRLLILAFLAVPSLAHACVVGDLAEPPVVEIHSTPGDCCYGEWAGVIAGTATNVETDSVVVVLYAQTDQYYIQPDTGEAGKTPVSCPNGAFSNATRGGQRYCAILARRSWNPPPMMIVLPGPGRDVLAIACSGDAPGGARSIDFSGLPWIVRSSGGERQGPGENVFSDSTANVWVDGVGKLHLRITHRNGVWQSAEVFTDLFLGHGTYLFTVETPPDSLDPRVVLGCFSYSDRYDQDGDEIDIEFSRWGDPQNLNSQFVVQPWDADDHIHRFDTLVPRSVHRFSWTPSGVSFASYAGGWNDFGPEIDAWNHALDVPQPDFERMRFNLWLTDTLGPVDGRETEAVIGGFRFVDVTAVGGAPAERVQLELGPPSPNPATDAVSYSVRLGSAAHVRVRVYDSSGRVVRTLLETMLPAGRHALNGTLVDKAGRRPPPGIYHLRVDAGAASRSRKITIH